jgi:hypothetical protein
MFGLGHGIDGFAMVLMMVIFFWGYVEGTRRFVAWSADRSRC